MNNFQFRLVGRLCWIVTVDLITKLFKLGVELKQHHSKS